MQKLPPRWMLRLFRWYCNDHLAEAVLGDLLELYERRLKTQSKRKANLMFFWNIIQFVQPFALRKKSARYNTNNFGMLRNYMKIAWRNMLRQKMYSAITVGGLALGLSICMIIALFVKDEMGYDTFRKDGDRIFKVYNNFTGPDADKWVAIQTPLMGVIKEELSDVEYAARVTKMWFNNETLLRREDALENTYENNFIFADPDILPILEIPMVYGTQTALAQKNSIVLSVRKARQFFGDGDPRGKTLVLNEERERPLVVTGVMEDYRRDSHFQYDYLISMKDKEFWPGEQTDWCCWNYQGYIKLKKGVDKGAFEKQLIPVRDKYMISYMNQRGDKSITKFQKYHSLRLQSISNIYLQPEMGDYHKHGDMKYIWLFSGIAAFIMILACINFINLSTARSANRAKEVGLRKTVGSYRNSLVFQFLTESVLYSLISFMIAVAIAVVALPTFNALSNRTLEIPWTAWWLFPILIGAAMVIGVTAGLYPSFYLSSFKPADVLKGSLSLGSRSSGLRSGMVIFQFTTSIVLIVSTFVVYRQMSYIMNYDVGFNRERILMLEGVGTLGKQREVLKNELLKRSDVQNVSISGYLPVEGGVNENYGWWLEGKQQVDVPISATKWRVDANYIETMKMKIVEGRDFKEHFASDSQAMIINRAMEYKMNLKGKAIGQKVTNNGNRHYTIVGIVENFNYRSLKDQINPACFVIEGGGESVISIRLTTDDPAGVIASTEALWRALAPNLPFRYSFMEEKFQGMYDDVDRMGRLFGMFALLAIAIACLGLFALSAFMIEQRAKEISIRLVMGASLKNIFALLTTNFMKLVLISIVISVPIAWYGMTKWLEDFEYKTEITADVFILSGVIAVVIALATVSQQALRAASRRPVETLKN